MAHPVRAAYTFTIAVRNGQKIIIITDLDHRSMSVTNDIENVLAEIAWIEVIDPSFCKVLCRDAQGNIDEYDSRKKIFVTLDARTEETAINKVLSLDYA